MKKGSIYALFFLIPPAWLLCFVEGDWKEGRLILFSRCFPQPHPTAAPPTLSPLLPLPHTFRVAFAFAFFVESLAMSKVNSCGFHIISSPSSDQPLNICEQFDFKHILPRAQLCLCRSSHHHHLRRCPYVRCPSQTIAIP